MLCCAVLCCVLIGPASKKESYVGLDFGTRCGGDYYLGINTTLIQPPPCPCILRLFGGGVVVNRTRLARYVYIFVLESRKL
jgi:hypothetical protein